MGTEETRECRQPPQRHEAGQSIVIVAFLLIGLVAMTGLAIDVGFVYARRSQLAAAVDAAALAGVVELTNGTQSDADNKAAQFLVTNNIPVDVLTGSFQSEVSTSLIGAQQYAITVTWPVPLFFLKVIGQDTFNLTRSATAAYFPLVDIYASRRVEDGALSTSNQSVFGPNICTGYGDPVSPVFNNPMWPENEGIYHYRIMIPEDYPSNIVRVELFDADSVNQAENDHTIAHTQPWIDSGGAAVEDASCSSTNQKNNCLIPTNEESGGLPVDRINLWWFVRVDENRGHGSPPGDGTCGQPSSYNVQFNTNTKYRLFYYAELTSGAVELRELATYTGQSGDPSRDYDKIQGNPVADHKTDMQWVSPGGAAIYDQPAVVPTDCGSVNGGYSIPGTDYNGDGIDDLRCAGQLYSPPASGKGFDIDLSTYGDMLVEDTTGNRYIYLDVQSLSGASENGFEVWAGPPDYVGTVSSNVNVRNVQIVNTPGSHSSKGATVFGMGRLPMNSNYSNQVDIPLVYIGPEYAGETVFVSLFDPDAGAKPPVSFFFDSIAFSDYSVTYGAGTDPDGRCFDGGSGYANECNNQWVNPAFEVKIPILSDACQTSPSPEVCTPFYGGRLTARYKGGLSDTYSWRITLTSLPYLIK